MDSTIPVIDIFAGPGGLGEGFSTYSSTKAGGKSFKIALSIEKDFYAHKTLTLRSFYRQFQGKIPKEYYQFVQGKISIEELYKAYPKECNDAKAESWKAQLGEKDNAEPNVKVHRRIKDALKGENNWVLIGGPPCQAYSVVGRSRRQNNVLDERKDPRVGLYREYLRILAVHNPAVFVMENVKGLLSARTKTASVFSRILKDLSDPVAAYREEFGTNGQLLDCPGYRIYSLVRPPRAKDRNGNPIFQPEDFLIRSENYGIPQTRHRVILIGIRKNLTDIEPGIIEESEEIGIEKVINGLPKLRSSLSKMEDSKNNWIKILKSLGQNGVMTQVNPEVGKEITAQINNLEQAPELPGAEYIPLKVTTEYKPGWFLNDKLKGVCNHQSRGHMESDLLRYLFVSSFGSVKGRSPKLEDFPEGLLPNHKNVRAGIKEKKFTDRFRVQLANKPAKTITSHISKDGHYYIHPDPAQCRSLTVREAARIQTFPDDYFFCGPRTAQFVQVGNAVPPLLANKFARIVYNLFEKIENGKKSKIISTMDLNLMPLIHE